MTRHLVARGHRNIAFITGPAEDFAAHERLRGFREAHAQALPGYPPTVLDGDFSEASGWAAGRAIVSMRERPSAVFAASDMMAVGCLAAFVEAGLELPRDIALAGFDDLPIARHLRPPLTTVRVPIAELGALALEQLVLDIAEEQRKPDARVTQHSADRSSRAPELCARIVVSLALNSNSEASMEREEHSAPRADVVNVPRRSLLLGAAAAPLLGAWPTVRADSWAASMSSFDPNALLDELSERTFAYFWETTDARTGLAPDRWPSPSCMQHRGGRLRADGVPDRRRARLDHARRGARNAR